MSFFAAVLAFQVAVVAGACAAARAAALWRSRGARVEDRLFVRRCTTISVAALSIAAAAWATAVGLSFHRLVHPNALTLSIGCTWMVAAPIVGGVLTTRLRVNASDDAPADEPISSGVFGFGERAIAVVRQHPLPACALATLGASASAMSRAETTVSGALPWGIAQAITVVACFVLLGPTLHLRRTRTA